MSFRIDDTPPAHGKPLLVATLKAQPSDFVVDERLEIDFDNAGEHLYLQVEKTSMNTDELVSLIEKTYAVGSADVGIAGLKDRHAVTTQWCSVRTVQDTTAFEKAIAQFNAQFNASNGALNEALNEAVNEAVNDATTQSCEEGEALRAAKGLDKNPPASQQSMGPGKNLRLVASARHSRKLRRGAHRGNRFVITLRDVCSAPDGALQAVDESLLVDRIQQIQSLGFPNYIGPQRFGYGGQNLQRARQWFRQPKKRASRQQRSLWLSASRSIIFNTVCAARVRDRSWSSLLDGEPAVLNGTRSFFVPEPSDTSELLMRRLIEFDIHPSAPWWGRGRPEAKGQCGQFEQATVDEFADLCKGLERAGLSQERRALRAQAMELTHHWLDKSTVLFSFSLSPGVFATTLLREIADVREPDRRSMNL